MYKINKKVLSAFLQASTSAILLFFVYRQLYKNIGADVLGVWTMVAAIMALSRMPETGLLNSAVKRISAVLSDEARSRTTFFNILIATVIMVFAMVLIIHIISPRLFSYYELNEKRKIFDSIEIYVYCAVILGVIAGQFQIACDIFGHSVKKNLTIFFSNIFYSAYLILMSGDYGIRVLVYGQIIQAIMNIFFCSFILRNNIFGKLLINNGTFNVLFDILKESFVVQSGALFGLIVDFVFKADLVGSGSAKFAAYYDTIIQVINRLKSIVCISLGPVLPKVAASRSYIDVNRLYINSYKMVALSAGLVFLPLAIFADLLVSFWFSSHNNDFSACLKIMCVISFFMFQLIPAFNFSMIMGLEREVSYLQVLMALFFLLTQELFFGNFNEYSKIFFYMSLQLFFTVPIWILFKRKIKMIK